MQTHGTAHGVQYRIEWRNYFRSNGTHSIPINDVWHTPTQSALSDVDLEAAIDSATRLHAVVATMPEMVHHPIRVGTWAECRIVTAR